MGRLKSLALSRYNGSCSAMVTGHTGRLPVSYIHTDSWLYNNLVILATAEHAHQVTIATACCGTVLKVIYLAHDSVFDASHFS